MVGDTPTRICRSDAPSATTNCNKSDIEYDIKNFLVRPYDSSPSVVRMTSSAVVSPASTLRMPSSRRVRMPISRARARKTEEVALS